MLVVTSDHLPGHQVQQVLGEVIGVVVCTRNAFDAGVKRLPPDDDVDRGAAVLERRVAAVEQLAQAAARRGATAVIAMRFDHRSVTPAWDEVCAYGTAVVAVPDGSLPPPR